MKRTFYRLGMAPYVPVLARAGARGTTVAGRASVMWHGITRRAQNRSGRYPAYRDVRLRMTRAEFYRWAHPALEAWLKEHPGIVRVTRDTAERRLRCARNQQESPARAIGQGFSHFGVTSTARPRFSSSSVISRRRRALSFSSDTVAVPDRPSMAWICC